MIKAVLDTNQFVSSLLTKTGPSAKLLEEWRAHAYLLVTSREIIAEIQRVLHYPHIAKKYRIPEAEVTALIELLEHEAIVLPHTKPIAVIAEDPTDNKILACALDAQASYLVSGDQHLLSLHQYQDVTIVTAREFLTLLDRTASH